MNSISFITHLAKFLRLNGDGVINGKSTLCLSTSALCLLNNFFDSILFSQQECEVPISSAENIDKELYDDVKFLFDFLKRTSSLKVIHGVYTLRGGIDLSRFTNLRVIELHKVPLHLIVSLNELSSQLKVLICHKSMYFLKEIFGNCAVEQNFKSVWTELKELNVSYNYLKRFDKSLGLLPKTEIIDASHNYIKNTDELQVLENLVFLNLSYNHLERVPILSGLSCFSLKILYMKNNMLEDLNGLEMLHSVEELDVSYNCLSDHSVLAPMRRLQSLKVLHVEGNPLFFHKRHRLLTGKFLHPSTITNGITLNGELLLKMEIMNPFFKKSESRFAKTINIHQTAINAIIEDVEYSTETESRPDFDADERLLESGNFKDCVEEVLIHEPEASPSCSAEPDVEVPVKKTAKSKTAKHKLREALIFDSSESSTHDTVLPTVLTKGVSSQLPVSVDTEVRELLETRRKELKDGWLIPTSSFQKLVVANHDLRVPPNTPLSSDMLQSSGNQHEPAMSSEEQPYSGLSVGSESRDKISKDVQRSEQDESSSLTVEKPIISNVNSVAARRFSELSDDVEVLDITMLEKMKTDLNARNFEYSNHQSVIGDISPGVSDDSELESDDESEENVFFLDKKEGEKYIPVLIKVGNSSMKELDSMSAKLIESWDLRSLSSATMEELNKDNGPEYQLHLSFDTAKASRGKRLYVFEDKMSAEDLLSRVKHFAVAKTLEDMILGALQCLKCHSQFSKKGAHRKSVKAENPFAKEESGLPCLPAVKHKDFMIETDACPNCGSTLLVEMETESTAQKSFLSSSESNEWTSEASKAELSVSQSSGGFLSNLLKSVMNSPSTKRKKILTSSPILKSKNVHSVSSDIGEETKAHKHEELSSTSQQLSSRKISSSTIISNQSSISVISDTESSNLGVIPEMSNQNVWSLSLPTANQSITLMSPSRDSQILEADEATIVPSKSINYRQENEETSVTESVGTLPFDQKLHRTESIGGNLNFLHLIEQKDNFSFDTFTSINHRLKLHFELCRFDDDEKLEACLKTGIVPLSTCKEFCGFFVISSKRFFIMENTDESSDEFEKTLKPFYSSHLKQLNVVTLLFGSQGFSVTCRSDSRTFVFLVRDADLCNCFVSLLTEIAGKRLEEAELPKFVLDKEDSMSQVHSEIISAYYTEDQETERHPEILLYMFAYWCTQAGSNKSPVCIVLTEEDVFLANIYFNKQTKSNDGSVLFRYTPLTSRKIVDIVEVVVGDDISEIELRFEDEEGNAVTPPWFISTAANSSSLAFISALKGPWETLFGVELPLYPRSHSMCT